MGAGFHKPTDTRYFALRFPRLLKIHRDRSFNDTISFEELQEMAQRCNEVLEDSERRDKLAWEAGKIRL
jgi:DNA ligase 4